MQGPAPRTLLRSFVAAFLALPTLGALLPGQGPPGGFAETFALAPDRKAALAQLVPGTDDYYYYHCLQAQHDAAFGEVAPLLAAWVEKHGRGARVEEIENRQALLTFDADPAATYAFLRQRLGLNFNHERQLPGHRPELPTSLDQQVISVRTLSQRALAMHPNSLDGFTEAGLEYALAAGVRDPLLRDLLQRLQHPAVPNLPALVARELRLRDSGGFGSLPIHERLLLAQLDELLQQQPRLLDDRAFVAVYLRRLFPSDDVAWQDDPVQTQAHLDRLWAFAQRLSPVHNALKSHVLYHRIEHDLAVARFDAARLDAYLRLPRQSRYSNPEYVQRSRGHEIVAGGADFPTGLPAVGDDEELVRAAFEQVFATADSYAPYTEFVREDWLRRVFAETKMLLGQGDMERWYSMLADPGYYEQLNARVELAFARSQPRHYAASDAVAIDVDVKNVPALLVKVYRIDAYEYLKATGKDVDASIDLDGVVANEETVHQYSEPPLRRVRRRFELPSLAAPGTYVVEFVGNGVASRAVVQKGGLTAVDRVGAAGHVFTVLDERGEIVRDAVAFCAGREIPADEHGEIAVPFLAEAAMRPLVLRAGAVASLQRFYHRAEEYSLEAGAFVDREALRSGQPGRLLVRPRLSVHGVPVALDLLQDAELAITAHSRDGVASVQTVRAPKWDEAGEYVHAFDVPKDLLRLEVGLRGRVDNLSRGKKDDVAAAPRTFAINGIDATAAIEVPLLRRDPDGWSIEVRGRSGEPLAGHAVNVTLRHRGFTDAVTVPLATDAEGRIALGALADIVTATAGGLPSEMSTWDLYAATVSLPNRVTGVVGETLRLPWVGDATAMDPSVATLVELRSGAPFRDASAQLALASGYVELRGLAAGDYELRMRGAPAIAVAVTAGKVQQGLAVSAARALALAGRMPLHVTQLAATDAEITVQLGNVGEDARVHVFATRYVPAFSPWARLRLPRPATGDDATLGRGESDFAAGRVLADELRYVLERRYAKKYPGNMLQRPSLLLNPWALDQWSAAVGLGGGAGGRFGGRTPGAGGPATPGPSERPALAETSPGAFADLDFLAGSTPMLCNLRPDANGRVVVARKDLGPGHHVHVVAVDDDDTVYRSLAVAASPLQPRDLRLRRALDGSQHFAEQQRIEFLAAGGEARVADVATATVQPFTTLADVHRVLLALTGDQDLAQFAFVLRWPQLSDDEKRQLYRQFACHELHFFLYRKDRAFFDAVLRPYLANKKHKEFFDEWLLGADLRHHIEPWAFARLNLVERILLLGKLPGQRDALLRYVREQGELLPVDLAQRQLGFLAALRSGDLDTDRGGLKDLLEPVADTKTAMERIEVDKAKAPGAPAAAPAEKPAAAAPPADDAMALQEGAAKEEELERKDRRGADRGRREQLRALFREPDPTRIYVEHDYWHRQRSQQDPALITANAFWRDFAAATEGAPFVSTNVADAGRSFTEAMLALAVLDLPFTAEAPKGERTGDALVLRAATPLLLARREILPAAVVEGSDPVLIRQDCFQLDDRYAYDGDRRRQKTVAGEFVAGVAYGSQVVLTNPTEVPRRVSVLLQIPAGALPLQNGFATRSVPVELGAFATTTLEHAFYFPAAGDFAHHPAQVASDGAFVGAAPAATRHVVAVPTTVDTASWEHVSQAAADAEVLAFLRSQNLWRLDVARMAWRLRDREFFAAAVLLLQKQLRYDATVWSYGLLHGDLGTARAFLEHQDGFVANCGRDLATPLLTLDAEWRRTWQHLEFEPLFHARAHRVGAWRVIQNADVGQQWQQFVHLLCYRPRLDAEDWTTVTQCLLLQGRTEDALAAFARVDAAQLEMKLQYDYLAAYLAFYRADLEAARRIASPHRDHPVERWRLLFRSVLQHIDEAQGAAVAAVDPNDRTNQQTQLAATAPQLDVAVEGGTVTIRHKNVARCELRYHRLDVEFAFSNSPFAQQGLAAVGWVQPSRVDAVDVAADAPTSQVPLPAEYQRGNIVVEVRGGGLVRRAQNLASAMSVQTVEGYGQLEVRGAATSAPLAQVYVKVYARMPGGAVRFHKDGYTDLRGRFDYASVSEAGSAGAERFALLVLSDQDGAVIRDVAAPNR